ncbi:DUF2314 domain-containing protein [Piscinibacter gummiphilus]|uniref:DUF2314 domain-containing protein n=1 Tax=Piscinibacter gummiphilus TaxID=946333 RepID=UPI0012FD5EC8|nr:DUF2314 domain-containing protein [Piscinibacter gummiphilus]GLS97886.1 hypothetical protein GCM10007918_51780 [Piscinibacter gummiphilus]
MALHAIAEEPNPYAAAQAELHYFNEAIADPKRATLPRVLVEIREDKKTERFWLNHARLDGKEYVGRLEAIPREVSSLQFGQEVRVQGKDVLDWTYQDRESRVIYGHYNVCSEFKAMSKKEAKEQMTYWGVACKPKQ